MSIPVEPAKEKPGDSNPEIPPHPDGMASAATIPVPPMSIKEDITDMDVDEANVPENLSADQPIATAPTAAPSPSTAAASSAAVERLEAGLACGEPRERCGSEEGGTTAAGAAQAEAIAEPSAGLTNIEMQPYADQHHQPHHLVNENNLESRCSNSSNEDMWRPW